MNLELSIIIPIYNEELNITNLYNRLKPVVEKFGITYELVFVNDGSKDKSIELIEELSKNDSTIKYIDLSRNFGHQVAVSAGLDYSKGAAIAIIDADLQDPPELIEVMYHKLKEGYENVYAKRKSRKDKNVLKKAAYKTFYRLLAKISHVQIPLDTGDYRIMSRKMANVIKHMPERNKFLRGQIAWAGFKQTFVEYDREERAAGEPGYTYKKLFKLAFDGITGFSDLPLRIATYSGFVVFFISLLLIAYSLYSYFFGDGQIPKGWTSLMISVMFLGGIQLLSLGIIGEYISRIQNDIRQRPLYIVKETNITI